jgi:hypothetical protein
MVPSNFKVEQLIVPTTAITAASANTAYVDTQGYDYLSVCIEEMSASAATQLTNLSLREDDTVPTAFTDASTIVAFTGGTATSATVGFVKPTPSSTTANVYRLNVDLRGRKRYIALKFDPAVSTRAAAQALLFKKEDGEDGTIATGTAGCRLVVNG